MNPNLVGSTYGRFCIKFPQSTMKVETQAQSTEPLVIYGRGELRQRNDADRKDLDF